MRKIFKSIMLVAAAAMAFASCQKQEILAPETFSTTITVGADVEQTKTYLGEDNWVYWGKGEALTLYVGAGETAKFFDSASTDAYDGKKQASFTVAIKDVADADSYALGGIYPDSAAMDDNKNAKQYKVILPATQNQVDGKYDPSAYIMVLEPEVVTELPSEYTASFRRAVALNKITLTGVKEDISSVEITVPEKKYLAGRRYMDLTTGESGEVYYDQSNKVTVNSSFTGTSIDVWFTSWGVELAEGDELSIKMTSATKTYTRTIVTRAEGIKFVEGDLNKLTVNMSTATEETLDNFSDEYLIVNTDLTRAAQAWAGGNNLPEFELNARDGVVYESEGIENCKMTIELQADGKYTIKDAKNQYLYAPSSDKNYLNGLEESSEKTCWTIVKDGDKYILTSLGNNSRNILRYNNSNKLFSCYASGQDDVTLYKYSDIKVDTTPSISLTQNSDQVAFDATSYEFTYKTKNITGNVAAAIKEGATMTNVSASVSNGTVTIKFDANADADPKTATIVLSYEGAISQEFVLTQSGKSETLEAGWVSTSFANLKEGDQVVIVSTKGTSNWAMSNDNGTGKAPTAVSGVSYSNDKLDKEPESNIIWYVGVDGENRVFYKDSGKASWLYCTATNNGIRVGTNDNKTFTLDNTSGYLKHIATNRYLGVYTTTPDWRCYTNTTGNTAGQTFKFFVKSGDADGETPTPTPDPEPDPEEPSTGVSKNAKITFGSSAVKINAASVTGTDSENNNWTITTVGTTSYTSNSAYYQVGSSSKPATSITFTTTLPAGASVSNVEAKFGGFSGTAGNVTLKVGDTSVGTGKLNATSDVIVKSTSTASGNKVTVTVTNIAKGVKCYYISVNYTE